MGYWWRSRRKTPARQSIRRWIRRGSETSADGGPLPVLGRFVRLRLTREDPPNWVSIGEVEVFGEGFRAEGTFESVVFDAGQPVNFGKVWFAGQTPPGTRLRVQFRTSVDGEAWPGWHRVSAWGLGKSRRWRGLDRAGARAVCAVSGGHGNARST